MTDQFKQSLKINVMATIYAIAIFFSIPIIIVMLQLLCVFFLCAWPIFPILGYYQRKEELNDND
jgi:hypothetical protein